MKVLLKLIRLPNLIIIAVTLYGFRFLVIKPYYQMSGTEFQLSSFTFGLVVAVAMMIAMTGYIINDFYDIEIDRINRPGRPAVSGQISPGSLPVIAVMLSVLTLAAVAILCIRMRSLFPVPIPLITLATVWWYARYLKKSFIWGNLIVAFMSALTLGYAWLFEWYLLNRSGIDIYEVKPITQIVAGIMVFAFLLSFIREIVKDLEDQEGDRRFGCRSLPIIKGDGYTKRFLVLTTSILILLLTASQFWLWKADFPMVAFWLIPSVELPLMIYLFRLSRASSQSDYHRLSTVTKWIMVGGISTMAVIWLNFRF
jgi:4-hydroxybenzoate polyprenyltransferase